MAHSSHYRYDQGSGCNTAAVDFDDVVRIQRLAGVDFANGRYAAKSHGLDGIQQSDYHIEYKRLKGIKVFSFQ